MATDQTDPAALVKAAPVDDELENLLRKAAQRKMTPEEYEAQRQSWVRGMTQPCEHGVVDFEQCPDCRAQADKQEDKTDE